MLNVKFAPLNLKAIFRTAFSSRVGVLHADEPAPIDPPPYNPAPSIPQSDEQFRMAIENARREEKQKLYSEIERLKRQIQTLTEQNGNYVAMVGERDQRIRALETAAANKGPTQRETELTAQIEALNGQLQQKQQEFDQLEANLTTKHELELYRRDAIASANGELVEELVTGTTKEEIDASVEKAKSKYAEIAAKFGGKPVTPPPAPATPVVTPATPPAVPQPPRVPPAAPPAAASGGNNPFGGNNKEAAFAQLSQLDPGSPEYARLRKELGLH